MLLSHRPQAGFSLVELIITIILGGIVASMTASILTLPINAYIDTSRRATLSDVAESALRRMQRDIRRALPNSIRISADGQTLELLHIVNGGRYRSSKDANDVNCETSSSAVNCDILDFSIADTSFDVLGELKNFSDITLNQDQVIIYPLETVGSNAYNSSENRTGLAATSTARHIGLNPAFQFPFSSPQQRFFIVDTPITYHCDTTAAATKDKVLRRYSQYTIQSTQPQPTNPTTGTPATPISAGSKVDWQANYVARCNFSYNAGSSTRSALVTLELVVTDDAGESIRLLHQVHVDNQP